MRTLLREALIRAAIMTACFLAGLGVAITLTGSSHDYAPADEHPVTAPTTSKIDRLFESGECWTGTAPEDVTIPGRVVLMREPGDQPALLGPKWVERALAQIFDGADHGIYRINGFCR